MKCVFVRYKHFVFLGVPDSSIRIKLTYFYTSIQIVFIDLCQVIDVCGVGVLKWFTLLCLKWFTLLCFKLLVGPTGCNDWKDRQKTRETHPVLRQVSGKM